MSIISLAITVIGFIIKMASSGERDNNYSQYETTAVEQFPETALDGILICYETFRCPDFNVRQVLLDLRHTQSAFNVKAAELRGNALYLHVDFADVFDKKSKNNEMVTFTHKVNTYFSVNQIQGTDNIIVYGCTNYNQRIKDGYRNIAHEIRKTILK